MNPEIFHPIWDKVRHDSSWAALVPCAVVFGIIVFLTWVELKRIHPWIVCAILVSLLLVALPLPREGRSIVYWFVGFTALVWLTARLARKH